MDRFRIATCFASGSNPSDLVSNVNDKVMLIRISQPTVGLTGTVVKKVGKGNYLEILVS